MAILGRGSVEWRRQNAKPLSRLGTTCETSSFDVLEMSTSPMHCIPGFIQHWCCSSLPVGSCSRWYFGAVWRWWYLYIIVLGYFRTIRYYPPSLARQLDPLRLFVFRDTTCFVQDATTERVTSDAPDVHNFAPASSGGIAGITPVLQDLWNHQLNQN